MASLISIETCDPWAAALAPDSEVWFSILSSPRLQVGSEADIALLGV